MTHYTVITARPVMRHFDEPQQPKIEIDGDPLAAMLADAKKINGKARRVYGQTIRSDEKTNIHAKEQRDGGFKELNRDDHVILSAIRKSPGIKVRDLCRISGLRTHVVQRSIRRLVNCGHNIEAEGAGPHPRRYTLKDKPVEIKRMKETSQATRVLRAIAENPGATTEEVSEMAKCTFRAVRYTVKNLRKDGYNILTIRNGHQASYELVSGVRQ